MLEEELGCELLVRKRNRILGLTDHGRVISELAARMLEISRSIRRVPTGGQALGNSELKFATTATLARYVLPRVAKDFQGRFPHVRLSLVHGDADQTIRMVMSGEADLGVSTRSGNLPKDILLLPYLRLYRDVITPRGHPLSRKQKVTLRDLAAYPMINLNRSNAGGLAVIEAFRERSIVPNVILEASDIATLKACVEQGLGIATLPTIAADPEHDQNVDIIDGKHLFAPTCNYIVLRRRDAGRADILGLLRVLSAKWTPGVVARAAEQPT